MSKIKKNASRLIPVLQIFVCSFTFAQEVESPRCSGLGGAGVTLNDQWAVLKNPAAIAFEESFAAGIAFSRNYFIKELDRQFFALVIPIKNLGVSGIGFSQYGYTLYKQQHLNFCCSRQFANKIAVGITLDYHHLLLGEGYGKKNWLEIGAGFQYRLTHDLNLAVLIKNPMRSRITDFNNERTTAIFSLGLSYDLSKKLKIVTEGLHHSTNPATFHAGLEYTPYNKIILRGGFSGAPLSGSFGFGVIQKYMKLDISVAHHDQLGYTPSFAISYQLNKKQ